MRFLLQASKLPTKGIRANTPLPTPAATKTFGQTCSPQCGCVLRFETSLNDQGKVAHATYHAKTVVTVCQSSDSSSSKKKKLQPQLSSRRNQPMFVECQCNTLHTLAKQVVAYLPNKSMTNELRNQVEFTGARSSLAFGHSVLQKYNVTAAAAKSNDSSSSLFATSSSSSPSFLKNNSSNNNNNSKSSSNSNNNNNHHSCLDLVEDALTSMIRQSEAPKPRRGSCQTYAQYLTNHFQPLLEQAQEEEFVERYGRALRRIRKPRSMSVGKDHGSNLTSLRSSVSALTMMDCFSTDDDELLEVEPPIPLEAATTAAGAPSKLDWETYVDEMNYSESMAS